ncbi:MAG: hypothetical protein ACRBBJ_06240 [Rhodomicrobiaceae bacterium]
MRHFKLKKIYRTIIFLSFLSVLSGCASNKQIDTSGATAIQNKKLLITTGNRPKFVITTPSKGFLASQGLLGFIAVHALSEDLAVTYNIKDPAITISQKLKQRLSSQHKMQVVEKGSYAQYELKVMSTAFGAAHGTLNFSKYSANYGATAELRDLRNNSIIASASCVEHGLKDADQAPTYDELFANQARRLKDGLNVRAQRCTDKIINTIFGN